MGQRARVQISATKRSRSSKHSAIEALSGNRQKFLGVGEGEYQQLRIFVQLTDVRQKNEDKSREDSTMKQGDGK